MVNEKSVRDNISKQVQNEIAQQKQAINNSLGIQKKEFDSTINQNKSYLQEQLKNYNTERIVNDDKIVALQNRRGGFYSGGLDYQLASNLRNTENAKSGLSRDINAKNQDILGRYNTLASQAAENIRMLESQAPDKIRQLVNNELARLRAEAFEREKFNWQKQMQSSQLSLQRAAEARRASSASASSSNTKVKPKNKTDSYRDGLSYWSSRVDDVRKQGAERVERALRNDPAQMQEILSQGYDFESVIDSLYNVASGGQFKNQKAYNDYVRSLRNEF